MASYCQRHEKLLINCCVYLPVVSAADIAEARGALALSSRLRALEATAAVDETFVRCSHCAAKLRARSRLAFLRDQVMRGKETNSLVLELCQDSAAVSEASY